MTIALLLLLGQDLEITQEKLDALHKEVRPLVEKATGRQFKAHPTVVIAKPDDVTEVLTEELVPQIKLQFPGMTEDKHRDMASGMARQFSLMLLGKYAASGNRIFVVAGNFKKLSDLLKKPLINSPGYLRTAFMHELVHALDEQEHKAMSRVGEIKTAEELIVWNAVIEGHAQHVTRAILVGEKKEELFNDFEAQTVAGAPGMSEGEKHMAEMQTMYLRLAYVDGRKFFDAVAASGRKTYVDDVFSKPPSGKDVILHPERYYDPKAAPAARDCKPLFDSIAADREDWTGQRLKMGELEVRASFGSFVDKKEVDAIIPRLVGASAMTLTPKDAPGTKMWAAVVMQMDGAEPAKTLLGMFDKMARAQDEKMKEGAVRIVKAEYSELKNKAGVANLLARKRMQVQGQEVPLANVLAAIGEYLVQFVVSNEEITDEDLAKQLERIHEFLKGK